MPNLRNLTSNKEYLTPVLNTVISGRINVLLLVKLVVVVDRKITLPLNVQKHKRKRVLPNLVLNPKSKRNLLVEWLMRVILNLMIVLM